VGWNLCRSGTGYAKSLCRGFHRSLQANVWIAPPVTSRPLFSTFFPIR
jgi:hypothetical protein